MLKFKSRLQNTPLSIFQALIAANQNAPKEVESTSNHHHPVVSSALEMLTFIMTHQPVFVDAELDSTMHSIIKIVSAASHASVSSAQLVPPQPPPNALHVSLVPLLIQIISATVFQDTLKLEEIAKLALSSAMVAKLQVSALPVLILKEDSIKTVIVQMVSMTIIVPSAKPVTHFVRLAPPLQPVLHASLKIAEAFPTDNVSAHQDTTKLLTLTTLSVAKNAVLNAKHAVVQTFA